MKGSCCVVAPLTGSAPDTLKPNGPSYHICQKCHLAWLSTRMWIGAFAFGPYLCSSRGDPYGSGGMFARRAPGAHSARARRATFLLTIPT